MYYNNYQMNILLENKFNFCGCKECNKVIDFQTEKEKHINNTKKY